MKRPAMTERGRSPLKTRPGSRDEDPVERPKKYLTGPDFVMSQETVRVIAVVSTSKHGNNPAAEHQKHHLAEHVTH